MRYWPEAGLQCTQCPVNFFLRYDELSGSTADQLLERVAKAWNARVVQKASQD